MPNKHFWSGQYGVEKVRQALSNEHTNEKWRIKNRKWKEDLDFKLLDDIVFLFCKTCTELGPTTRPDLAKDCPWANSSGVRTNKVRKINKHLDSKLHGICVGKKLQSGNKQSPGADTRGKTEKGGSAPTKASGKRSAPAGSLTRNNRKKPKQQCGSPASATPATARAKKKATAAAQAGQTSSSSAESNQMNFSKVKVEQVVVSDEELEAGYAFEEKKEKEAEGEEEQQQPPSKKRARVQSSVAPARPLAFKKTKQSPERFVRKEEKLLEYSDYDDKNAQEPECTVEKLKSHSCTFCPYTFASASRLKLHLATHTQQQPMPFVCTQCDFRTAYKDNLQRHLVSHAKKPYACSMCDFRCTESVILRSHVEMHKIQPLKCTFCDFQSHNRRNLVRHERRHSVEFQEKQRRYAVVAKLLESAGPIGGGSGHGHAQPPLLAPTQAQPQPPAQSTHRSTPQEAELRAQLTAQLFGILRGKVPMPELRTDRQAAQSLDNPANFPQNSADSAGPTAPSVAQSSAGDRQAVVTNFKPNQTTSLDSPHSHGHSLTLAPAQVARMGARLLHTYMATPGQEETNGSRQEPARPAAAHNDDGDDDDSDHNHDHRHNSHNNNHNLNSWLDKKSWVGEVAARAEQVTTGHDHVRAPSAFSAFVAGPTGRTAHAQSRALAQSTEFAQCVAEAEATPETRTAARVLGGLRYSAG